MLRPADSTKQSPSRVTDTSSASQEIHRILLYSEIHYLFRKRPPLAPVLNHMNPVHSFTPFLNISSNKSTILPRMPRPSSRSLPFGFPH